MRFVEGLSDFKFVALDAAIQRVLAVRGLDLVRTEWMRPLGGGVVDPEAERAIDDMGKTPYSAEWR